MKRLFPLCLAALLLLPACTSVKRELGVGPREYRMLHAARDAS